MRTPQLADSLRRALLQAAIEGKLSERQADDGHAQDLLKQIQADKAALVKAGRLKKSKGLPEIGEDEKPFAIPENWVWVRLGDIFSMQAGKFIKADDISEIGEYPCFGGNGMRGYTKTYNREGHFPLIGRQGALCGNIKIANGKFYATEHAVVVETFANCNPLWAGYFLTALDLNQYATSTAQPGLSVEKISATLIPFPPLAEQARIVAKLDALLAETDALKAQETALADAQKNFPKMLRASLLQAAIEGKLTERESDDGHAQDLLAAIQAEKAAQIQAGRLKKSKRLPEISEDEKPFAIPENWVWVRLGDLAEYKKGPFGSAITKSMFIPKGDNAIKVYEQKNAIKKDASLGNYYISKEYFEGKLCGFEVKSGDILVSCAGTIGESYILPEGIEKGIINQALMRIQTIKPINQRMFLLIFDYAIKTASANAKGTAIKNIPPFEILKNLLVPLPPLAEQARIVAKLDALLAQIEPLENLS